MPSIQQPTMLEEPTGRKFTCRSAEPTCRTALKSNNAYINKTQGKSTGTIR